MARVRKNALRMHVAREARLNLRISTELRERIDRAAAAARQSVSAYIEQLLEDYVGAAGRTKRKD